MSEWAIFKLGALCPKITDGSHRSPADFVGGLPMFSVKDMEIQGFNYSRVKTISEEEFNLLVKSGCQPEIDDILIAKDGSVMKHIFRVKTNPDYVLLSSIAILKPNKSYIFPQFLVYAIKSPETIDTILTNYVSGSGVPRIVLKDFKNVEINIPPLPEQKAIAAVLSSLDDKIDLLHRQNKTLEAMAETLFRQWFIEEAKEDWESTTLSNILSVIESGSRPKGGIDPTLESGIASIGAESINGIGNFDFSKTKYISVDYFSSMRNGIVKDYDVLIYKDGAYIGKKAMFGHCFPFKSFAVNEHVFILRANEKANQIFLYFLLEQDDLSLLNTNSAQLNPDLIKHL